MQAKPRILLAERLDQDAERRLSAGAEVVRPAASDEDALCASIGDCDALVARTTTRVTRRLLESGGRLRVVGVAGVGLDNVDVAAAEALGVAVLHTPEASSDAVAEFTIALILQLLRPTQRLAAKYATGEFQALREKTHGPELRELTVGILGMGRIGSRVGRIAAAGFGATVIYNDIVDVGPFEFPAQSVDKPTLWSRSDILTLHVPATDLTRGLVGAEVLAQMRPTAYLVNAARGVVVDTEALTESLRTKRIAGAALDVVDREPLPPSHPLFSFENCILTPHAAARTHAGLQRMYAIVDRVLEFLDQS